MHTLTRPGPASLTRPPPCFTPSLSVHRPALSLQTAPSSGRRSRVNDEFSPALTRIPRATKFYDPLAYFRPLREAP
jgi:hypothetical protein